MSHFVADRALGAAFRALAVSHKALAMAGSSVRNCYAKKNEEVLPSAAEFLKTRKGLRCPENPD